MRAEPVEDGGELGGARRELWHTLLHRVRTDAPTVVAISHDDELLDAVPDHVYDLDDEGPRIFCESGRTAPEHAG